VQTLATQRGARTIALDERTGRVFLSTATYVESAPTADGKPPAQRFTAVLDSYQLLVIEP